MNFNLRHLIRKTCLNEPSFARDVQLFAKTFFLLLRRELNIKQNIELFKQQNRLNTYKLEFFKREFFKLEFFNFFYTNVTLMVVNSSYPFTVQLMFLSKYKNIEKNMSFHGKTIKSSDTVELLGIILDKNISFKRHIQNICRKANNKTKALLRIRKFLNLEQAQVLAEAYISSNFRYCPLIWMFCGKMSDNLIAKSNYRTLRAIYYTQTRSYEELLHLSGKKKIHTQNLQILMVEVYKCLNNISLSFT